MKYSVVDIAKACKGRILGKQNNWIKFISADSRSIINPEETLFFAIRGENLDGHNYINDLIERGVSSFIISDQEHLVDRPNLTFILVNNVVLAMQQIAGMHRQKFNVPVVSITGSNGKTIVKEWLSFLLGNKFRVTRSPRSYNSQTGVPLSVWEMNENTQIAVFEAGISQTGEMQKLQKIILPDIGIITNIGDAHQQYFTDYQEKANEKIKLFESCKKIVFNSEDPYILKALENQNINAKCLKWSYVKNADIIIENIEEHDQVSKITLSFKNNKYELIIPFKGKAWIENAVTCFAALISINENPIDYLELFQKLPAVAMRMEVLNGINGCRIINDSYNSDFQAINTSLEQLVRQSGNRDLLVIVSDILQSGKPDHILYKELSDLFRSKKINNIIGVGKSISANRSYFSGNTCFFKNTESLIKSGTLLKLSDKALLLKGARPFKFERLVKILQEKSHHTVFEINLNAIENNLNFYRQKIGKKTKIMVMVKAFSYGSGYYEIAHHLQYLKVDYLAVAYADEGIELRRAGIDLPIMVMNPEPESFELMCDNRLEPELYSLEIFKAFSEFANTYINYSYPVHLKFDTGMHRLGFLPENIEVLTRYLEDAKNIEIASVFTHLVASEHKSFDEFTHLQVKLLNQMCDNLSLEKSIKHVLNSSGITRFPEYHFDMVRLGIGLYGIAFDPDNELEQTGVFKTKISQIRNLKKGQTVSYNRSGKLLHDSTIATIPVGYADGINRKLGNGNWQMLVNEKYVPTVGDICMDMCMIDITGVDVNTGDEVIIIGGSVDVEKMATVLGTIPYEILTNIGQRVKRVYIKE
jgi:Alr-MurF fusion protein